MTIENTVEAVEVAAVAVTLKDRVIGFASNRTNQYVAGGVVATGLLAWGAKKLYDRHQANKAVVAVAQAAQPLVGEVIEAARAS